MNALVKSHFETFGDYTADDYAATKPTSWCPDNTVRARKRKLPVELYYAAAPIDRNWISSIKIDARINKAITELSQYSSLAMDWNGYGGVPFTGDIIDRSQALVRALLSWLHHERIEPLEVTPGPAGDGSIDVELRLNEAHIIFTLYQNSHKVNFYVEFRDASDKEHLFEYSEEKMENLLSEAVANVTQ